MGGFFSSKKKTKEEIERRINDVYDQYQSILQSQIIGHMKSLMKQSLKDVGALTDERASQIDAIQFNVPFSLIEDQVQRNSIVTGDAVLNFANRVREATRRYFSRETDAWKDEQTALLKEVSEKIASSCFNET